MENIVSLNEDSASEPDSDQDHLYSVDFIIKRVM